MARSSSFVMSPRVDPFTKKKMLIFFLRREGTVIRELEQLHVRACTYPFVPSTLGEERRGYNSVCVFSVQTSVSSLPGGSTSRMQANKRICDSAKVSPFLRGYTPLAVNFVIIAKRSCMWR